MCLIKHLSIVFDFFNFMELFEDSTTLGNKILTEHEASMEECRESAKVSQEMLKEDLQQNFIVKENVHVRIFQLPSCPELSRIVFPKNQDLNSFLQISGII